MIDSQVADILGRVHALTIDELLAVQEGIIRELRQKVVAPAPNGSAARHVTIPGAVRRTHAEIEAELSRMFTPEQRAEAAQADISNLPPGKKTIVEYLQEDREDRIL